MKREKFELSDLEFTQLNTEYARGKGSALIGYRSEAIVRLYFRRKYPDCEFRQPTNGADLEVVSSPNRRGFFLEVKGTEDSSIAWGKLKVSGVPSHQMLVEEKIPLYRVTNVFEKKPVIYMLKYGEDFDLVQEPRWRIRRMVSESEHERETVPSRTQKSRERRGKRSSKC